MNTTCHASAACLTPPLPGGVAVIEVVGAAALGLVNPLLQARRPVDLSRMSSHELRLACLMDGEETIDDVVVSVRSGASGPAVVDLTLHGGPRVVQRALVLLKRVGVRIVEQDELSVWSWPPRESRQGPWLTALLRAKTPAVVEWLMRMRSAFPAEIRRIVTMLEMDETKQAGEALDALSLRGCRLRYLLEGVRVVLAGGPNVGKSTLANALAEREGSIVSPTAGTTRDWVEHPTAIGGVPFMLVDTAGLRESEDFIEREAVRRTRTQMAAADLILQVMDISEPPLADDLTGRAVSTGRKAVGCPIIYVWNKRDLPVHPAQEQQITLIGSAAIQVSARTGEGLGDLRDKMARSLGLAGWETDGPGPFDEEAAEICLAALSELKTGPNGFQGAVQRLKFLISEHMEVERSSAGGI